MDILEFLANHGIPYRRCDHPPVFTCEEAERLVPDLPGAKTKNLLLRDKRGRRHFLVVVGYEKTVDLGALATQLQVKGLRLASPERLRRFLGLDPGSVTILGLVHDRRGEVELVVDQALWKADAFRCHPLVNTATLVIARPDLERFLEITGHCPRVLQVVGR
jgi:Ala-tRNA(Pro) deacylase